MPEVLNEPGKVRQTLSAPAKVKKGAVGYSDLQNTGRGRDKGFELLLF